MQIRELCSEEEWHDAFPCLQSLRPNLERSLFLARRESLRERSYFLHGMFVEGRLVCVAGYVLQPHVERGIEFWLHDFATLPDERSKGYGEAMMRYLENIARSEGCGRLMLHTLLRRERAQQFYRERAHYEEYGLVYAKPLAAEQD